MPFGNRQQHIRIHVHRIAEKAVCLVAAVFKIGFVLRKAGGVHAVPAADQHNGEALLVRYPHHAFMAVDQPMLPRRELGPQQSLPAHGHQLMVRAAETDNHRPDRDAFLQRFSPQALPGRVDQIHLAVYQRADRIVLKIGAVCFHRRFLRDLPAHRQI